MAKRNTEETLPVKITPSTGLVAPDYFAGEEDDSLAALQKYRVLSRAKIIESMSGAQYKAIGDPGTLILVPVNMVLSPAEGGGEGRSAPFHVVPVFFFNEYMTWRDRKDKSEKNPIMERSFDPASKIAIKAANKDTWFERYGEVVTDKKDRENYGKPRYKARHQEHLNFACFVWEPGHPLHMTEFVISFCKGEYSTGVQWSTKIQMRKQPNGKMVPSWGQIWRINTTHRVDGDKQWYGYEISNPDNDVPAFIPQEAIPSFKNLYTQLKESHAAKLLRVNVDDIDENGDTPAETDENGEILEHDV